MSAAHRGVLRKKEARERKQKKAEEPAKPAATPPVTPAATPDEVLDFEEEPKAK